MLTQRNYLRSVEAGGAATLSYSGLRRGVARRGLALLAVAVGIKKSLRPIDSPDDLVRHSIIRGRSPSLVRDGHRGFALCFRVVLSVARKRLCKRAG